MFSGVMDACYQASLTSSEFLFDKIRRREWVKETCALCVFYTLPESFDFPSQSVRLRVGIALSCDVDK